ncbi:MAG: NUDIX hydrolase [Cypionkella sp.]|nr:NUDIX hydrolase [Cypionkella sp.]
MPHSALADAASIILLRGTADEVQVLMGKRAANAAFMPSKFVFPGGRVDREDAQVRAPQIMSAQCRSALMAQVKTDNFAAEILPEALQNAVLRELHEETGLQLARPHAAALRFVFRAITPQGRPRRFDARFFLANAADFDGDYAAFSHASGELADLQFLPLSRARSLNLPFITQVILAEISQNLTTNTADGVPFFDNSGPSPCFSRL